MSTSLILCIFAIVVLIFLIYTIYDDDKVDKENYDSKYEIMTITVVILCAIMLCYEFCSLHNS